MLQRLYIYTHVAKTNVGNGIRTPNLLVQVMRYDTQIIINNINLIVKIKILLLTNNYLNPIIIFNDALFYSLTYP